MDLLARLHGHDFDRASVVVRPQNQMIARNLDIFHRAVSVARDRVHIGFALAIRLERIVVTVDQDGGAG
jgi:hypothetical protein